MGAEHSSKNANAASNKFTSVRKQVGKTSTALTEYHKSLLRTAWQHITKSGTATIGNLVFRKMLSSSPGMKTLFQHVIVIEGAFGFGLTPIQSYHQHGVIFTELLSGAIRDLDDFTLIDDRCRDFGAQHAKYQVYGFRAEFWDTFGESLMEAAREWEGWRKHRETLKAWTILVSFIVDRLRHGYENAVKRQNQQNETVGAFAQAKSESSPAFNTQLGADSPSNPSPTTSST